MEALPRKPLGRKKQHSAASSHRLITAPRKSDVFLHFTVRENGFLEDVDIKVCMHMSRGALTALIKVAMQHTRLAGSTFAGPAEEHRAERSITRGVREGSNSRQEINVELESCINQQHVLSGIGIKMVAKVFRSGRIHNWINYSWLTVSFSTARLPGPAWFVSFLYRGIVVSRGACLTVR